MNPRLNKAVLVSLLMSLPAWAQSDPEMEQSRRRYDAGAKAVQEGRFREALAEFAAAYEFSRMPDLLWNMAECARKLDERDRALSLYKQYVSEAPQGEKVAEANERIRELEAQKAPPATPPPAPVPTPAPVMTAPPPVPVAAPIVAAETSAKAEPADRPVYKKWWFWTGVGVAVAAGVIVGVVVSRRSDESGPEPIDCDTCLDPPLMGTWK